MSKTVYYMYDRVNMEGERGKGQGFDHFISHHNLGYNKGSGTQYLMDDYIYIQVSEELLQRDPGLWLLQ